MIQASLHTCKESVEAMIHYQLVFKNITPKWVPKQLNMNQRKAGRSCVKYNRKWHFWQWQVTSGHIIISHTLREQPKMAATKLAYTKNFKSQHSVNKPIAALQGTIRIIHINFKMCCKKLTAPYHSSLLKRMHARIHMQKISLLTNVMNLHQNNALPYRAPNN